MSGPTSAEQRRHAQMLRDRDKSPAAQAVAARIAAGADLDDALAGREEATAPTAQIVDNLPILGRMVREGGIITSIEHPWEDSDVSRAAAAGVDIAWEWCHDPMAGLRQGELVRIYVGTAGTGPLLQWDRTRKRWYVLSNQRNYGRNYACGGTWSCEDRDGSASLAEAIARLPADVAARVAAVVSGRQTDGQEEHMTEQGGYTCTPEVNPIITYEYLSSLSPLPCQPRRDAFRAAFPEGTTLENALAWASNDDLSWIVCYASPAMCDKAAAELLRRKAADDCLRWIVCYARPAMRDKARAELSRRGA